MEQQKLGVQSPGEWEGFTVSVARGRQLGGGEVGRCQVTDSTPASHWVGK